MKKYIIVGTLALILIMPMIGASEEFSTERTEIIEPSATFESTHTVLIEYDVCRQTILKLPKPTLLNSVHRQFF